MTGNPYTPVTRAYYDVNSYAYVPVYGAPYSGRLPAFNQLDLRVDKTFAFNAWKLTLYLDIQNVYNSTSARASLYSFDYKQPEYLNGLPFLPIARRARRLLMRAVARFVVARRRLQRARSVGRRARRRAAHPRRAGRAARGRRPATP